MSNVLFCHFSYDLYNTYGIIELLCGVSIFVTQLRSVHVSGVLARNTS